MTKSLTPKGVKAFDQVDGKEVSFSNEKAAQAAPPNQPAGGASRDRTDDLKLAKLALSQLSYGPVTSCPQAPGTHSVRSARSAVASQGLNGPVASLRERPGHAGING